MDHFSEQLANLQRAASRAGRGEDGNNSGSNNNDGRHRRDDNNNASYQQHRSRDGGGRRDDRYYYDPSADRSDHQSRKRGRDGDMRDGRRSYDDRGRFYNNDRGDHYRGSNRYGNNAGRGGGRGHGRGGRWRNDHGRNNIGEQKSSSEQSTTLAELVSNVQSSYQASLTNAANDAKITKGGKRRHIALLFLTIDDLPHEHIWKEWLKPSSSNKNAELTTKSSHEAISSSSSNETPMVSVLCHAKFPDRIKSEWLRQRHLLQQSRNYSDDGTRQQNTNDDGLSRFHSHRPEWGSVEITRAMIDLMEEALRIGTGESTHFAKYLSTPGDELGNKTVSREETKSSEQHCEQDIPSVDRFIFVSESCLPVTTLEEVELALFGPKNTSDSSANLYDRSWVNARSTPNNGYSRQLQWDAIRTDNVPHNYIWKADQWMVLTRLDAEAVASLPSKLNGRQLWPAFRKCRASDEIYFPTALSILGIVSRQNGEAQVDEFSKGESCAGRIRRRRITYCDWSLSAKNPASFTSQDWKDVAFKAREEGCLFARKFVLLSSLRDGVKKHPQPVNNDGVVSVDDWINAVVKKQVG
ncbi:hypothetical protein ACHAXM_005075 [Skeletonema potamos]